MRAHCLKFLAAVAAMFAISPVAVAAGWRQYPAVNPFSGLPLGMTIDARGEPWVLNDKQQIQAKSGPAVNLPGPRASSEGVIASDAPGAVMVAWTVGSADAGTVSVARHSESGWAEHVALETIAGPFATRPYAPAIAAGPVRSVVAWLATPAGASEPALRAAWREAGQAWTSPVTVATQSVGRPIVGVDAAGNALVVWRSTDARRQIVAARLDAGASTWAEPQVISGAAPASAPVLGVAPAGDVVVAWVLAGRTGVRAVTGRLPGPFGTPFVVNPNGRRAAVAVGPGGRAAITFADGRTFFARTRDGRGRFGPARSIAPVPRSSQGIVPSGGFLPRVAIDRGGMTALWPSDRLIDGEWIDTSLLARRRARGAWSRVGFAGNLGDCCGPIVRILSFGVAATGNGHIAAFVADNESDDRGLEPVNFDSYHLYVYSP